MYQQLTLHKSNPPFLEGGIEGMGNKSDMLIFDLPTFDAFIVYRFKLVKILL